jgi:hypothetical protein
MRHHLASSLPFQGFLPHIHDQNHGNNFTVTDSKKMKNSDERRRIFSVGGDAAVPFGL